MVDIKGTAEENHDGRGRIAGIFAEKIHELGKPNGLVEFNGIRGRFLVVRRQEFLQLPNRLLELIRPRLAAAKRPHVRDLCLSDGAKMIGVIQAQRGIQWHLFEKQRNDAAIDVVFDSLIEERGEPNDIMGGLSGSDASVLGADNVQLAKAKTTRQEKRREAGERRDIHVPLFRPSAGAGRSEVFT